MAETDVDVDPAEAQGLASQLVDELASDFTAALEKQATTIIKAQLKTRLRFERNLYKRWRPALDLLELVILAYRDLGLDFNAGRPAHPDVLHEVLLRLWARGCQVALEIHTLLRSGFADGAHGRWRTLHELAVVALFIREHPHAAQVYWDYTAVANWRAAKSYQRVAPRLGYELNSEEEMSLIAAKYKSAVKLNPDLVRTGDYGWATNALRAVGVNFKKKRGPTFSQLEEHAGVGQWRAHFGFASHNVHAGPHGVLYRIGTSTTPNAPLAGPTWFGLTEAAHACAIALMHLTHALVLPRSQQDVHLDFEGTSRRTGALKALIGFVDRVGEAFLRIDKKLKPARGGRKRRGRKVS